MKGAVTGVFSYSGRFIAEALLARGWEVVALGRRRPPPADSLAERVDFYPLLLDDEEGLVAALSDCEVVPGGTGADVLAGLGSKVLEIRMGQDWVSGAEHTSPISPRS